MLWKKLSFVWIVQRKCCNNSNTTKIAFCHHDNKRQKMWVVHSLLPLSGPFALGFCSLLLSLSRAVVLSNQLNHLSIFGWHPFDTYESALNLWLIINKSSMNLWLKNEMLLIKQRRFYVKCRRFFCETSRDWSAMHRKTGKSRTKDQTLMNLSKGAVLIYSGVSSSVESHKWIIIYSCSCTICTASKDGGFSGNMERWRHDSFSERKRKIRQAKSKQSSKSKSPNHREIAGCVISTNWEHVPTCSGHQCSEPCLGS